MGNSDYLSSNVVIQAVDAVGVNKAVTHPKTSLNTLLHFWQHVECSLKIK